MLPFVAPKLTGIGGKKTVIEGTAPTELCVMSAVTEVCPPGGIGLGEALILSTSQGLASSMPVLPANTSVPLVVPLQPAPPVPGPKLQPHQVFSTSMVALLPAATLLPYCTPTVLPTMRLKFA